MPGIAVLKKNGVMAGVYFQHIYGASTIPDSQPVVFLLCLHVWPAELEYGAIVVCSIRGSDLIGVQLVVRGLAGVAAPTVSICRRRLRAAGLAKRCVVRYASTYAQANRVFVDL